jgi:hypothetical protein
MVVSTPYARARTKHAGRSRVEGAFQLFPLPGGGWREMKEKNIEREKHMKEKNTLTLV